MLDGRWAERKPFYAPAEPKPGPRVRPETEVIRFNPEDYTRAVPGVDIPDIDPDASPFERQRQYNIWLRNKYGKKPAEASA